MATAKEWQGRVGQEWARRQTALEALLGPAGAEGLRIFEARQGERILDLGCGAGQTSLALAKSGALVTGVDISPDLLAVAKTTDDTENVTWLLGDAASIRYDQTFDGLYSRCGAMFFDQPMIAFAHLRFQMRPGARLLIVCWRDAEQNAWARVPLEIARSALGEAQTSLPQSGAPGPFGWARPEVFMPILRSTGWQNLTHQPFDASAVIGNGVHADPLEAAVQFCLRIGPLASRLRGLPPSLRDHLADLLRDGLGLYQDPAGVVRLGTAAWIITATS